MESTSEYSQDSEIEKEAMTIANNIISDIIDDSMTDFEKTMGIILWMLGNIEYESGWAIRDYDVKTAIETLKSRNAQYIGYMSAFYLLANAADLQVKYILGVKEPNFIISERGRKG